MIGRTAGISHIGRPDNKRRCPAILREKSAENSFVIRGRFDSFTLHAHRRVTVAMFAPCPSVDARSWLTVQL